jgi:lysophospholipase L1-like esterase
MKKLLSIVTVIFLVSTQWPAVAAGQGSESVEAFQRFLEQSLQKRSITRQDVEAFYDSVSSFWDEDKHVQDYLNNPDRYQPLLSLYYRNQALYGPDTAPNFEQFRPEIETFKRFDAKNTVPSNAILFVGSSSIVHWKTAAAFPSYPVINRGFGGSTLADVNYFYDDVVKKYKPAVIVLYCDNDMYHGDAPSVALQRFQEFSNRVARDFPSTKLLFLSMKPTPTDALYGEHVRENETIANKMIKSFMETRRNMRYVDVATPMFQNGGPHADIFLSDGMHMNARGYDIWNPIVAKQLAKLYAPRIGHERQSPAGN